MASSGADRGREALAELCQIYWPPVYAFIRGRGHGREDAEDLTQGLFESLLERESFASADPEKGKMRSFLRVAAKRYVINQSERGRAAKRGGGILPVPLEGDELEARLADGSAEDPERAFDRRWALTLLEKVLDDLGSEYHELGKGEVFEALRPALSAEDGARMSSAEAAVVLGITDGAARVAIYRLRKRYRELLRTAIAQTVEHESEIDGEIRYLMELFTAAESGR